MKTSVSKPIAALALAAILFSPAMLFAREPQPSRERETRNRPTQVDDRRAEEPHRGVRADEQRFRSHRSSHPVVCRARPEYPAYVYAPPMPYPGPVVLVAPPAPPPPPAPPCMPPPAPVQIFHAGLQILLSF